MEIWKPVLGYEGLYEVSDHGRVRSVERTIRDVRGREKHYQGQILQPGPSHGTPGVMVALSREGRVLGRMVGTLVATAFLGPRPAGTPVVRHNGNPADNRLANLAWPNQGGTPS